MYVTEHALRAVVTLTGNRTAEDPGMVGSGRVPGMEAGRGCLCLFRRCSSEDRDPGTGLKQHTPQTTGCTSVQNIIQLSLFNCSLKPNIYITVKRKML